MIAACTVQRTKVACLVPMMAVSLIRFELVSNDGCILSSEDGSRLSSEIGSIHGSGDGCILGSYKDCMLGSEHG